MDRDGEELVTIVQNLDGPGVTLTVSNRASMRGRDVENRMPSRPTLHINSANNTEKSPAADHRVDKMPGVQAVSVTRRASVETTTGADNMRVSKGSQICDDRYTSSYKLAHCQMTPSSPPEAVSEFPPQRREPCRNQGNFEIGGNGSAQWCFHIEQGSGQGFRQATRSGQERASTSRIRQNGGGQIWRDKGSSHRYCNTKRDPDAFEQSLRKYPSMGPFRTASHDLIEKLIRYTQAKNFQEMSRSSKSVRSLRHQKAADPDDLQSKHQQTYTRQQDGNVSSNSGVQVGYIGRTRNFKLYSPVSDSRNLRNRENAFSTSYDYLKAGSPPDGRSNRSDGSPSPTGSKSPEDSRSPVGRPVRFGSPGGSKSAGSPCRSRRPERPIRFERSVRDLSLIEMSKYIRNTVRQICNEKPVVYQVCPKLKNRYNQHKKVCPNKSEQTSDLVENEEDTQASGSVLSRLIRSFSGWSMPLTNTGCQCNRTDCYCTKATQCAYDSEVSTNTVGCSCRIRTIEAKTSCSRDLTCVCARKAQEQAYYYKRVDEAISEWLKDVPVHSSEYADRNSDTAIKELRQNLKQLPDDKDFDENVRNEISSFIDDLPLWNPDADEEDDIMFKNQLADKLIDKIVAIPRKPDRFREVVTKCFEDLDFEDDNEEIDMEVVIDNFVNKLKSLAAGRPACDMKYKHILRKEIIELLVELPLNYDSLMFKRKAHQLAIEIVNLPRNIKLSGDTDSTSVFEENISEWICEHGLCRELKKDPKLIEGLANTLKSHGIGDEELIATMKELIFEFVDDVDTAVGILDEFVDELMKTVPSTVQKDNLYSTQSMIGHGYSEPKAKRFDLDEQSMIVHGYSEPKAKRFDPDELHEVVSDWISELPGASDFSQSKFEDITEDIVTMVEDKQGKEDLDNNIFEYIVDTELPIDLDDLHARVNELLKRLNALPPSEDFIEEAKRHMVEEMFKIIDTLSVPKEKQEELRKSAFKQVQRKLTMMSSLNFIQDQDDVKEALVEDMSRMFDKLIGESQDELKNKLISSLSTTFDKSFTRLGKDESDLKQTIEKDVRKTLDELPVGTTRKEDLMEQVNKTLCTHMNKPLPPNVKNIINDDISNIIENCPISEDRSLCGRLKKTLFDVLGQHLDMPKYVCDFQCKIEKDMGMVIDRCPIDPANKRELKKCVQDIFTKNGDRPLSEEVVKTIQEEICTVCSDLPIPNDQKFILKKAVGASVSQYLNDALSSISHDLIKLRKRLYDTMTNVIESSPIKRDVKTNLKSQLKSVLERNLDSSLSDEEKVNILDEVSIILEDDMPKEKRKNLTNKLSNKMDTFQRKEKTNDLAEMITKDVDQLFNILSDSVAKKNVKKDIKAVLLDILYNPLTIDKQHKIKADIINEIDEIDIPKNEKNYLKSNVVQAMTKKLNELIAQEKEVPEIITTLGETIGNEIKDSSISKDKQELLDRKLHNVLVDNLVRDVTNEQIEATREKLTDIVDDLNIDKGKTEALKTQLLNNADKYFEKSAQERMQTKELTAAEDESMSDYQRDYNIQNNILQGMKNSIDEASIPEEKKIELKTKLKNIAAKNLKKPLSENTTQLTKPELKELENKTKRNILRGLEKSIDEAPIPQEKKMELKKKLKDLTPQYLKNQLNDDVLGALKDEMNEMIDEMNLPKHKKDKLKSELTATVDDNMSDYQRDYSIQNNILQGLKNSIDEASIPEEKKIELKTKLKNIAAKNLKKPLSENTTQLTKPELKELENKTKRNILRGLEKSIDEAPIPQEKKMELKNKLKDLTPQYLKNQLNDDVLGALKDEMNEMIDEMNLPKHKKDKLKSELTATVDDNMSDYQRDYSIQNNILQGLKNSIDEASIPEEKKIELKTKLKNIAAKNLKKPLSENTTQLTKPELKELENKTKRNILQGLEKSIDEAPIPQEKKMELKKKLKDLTPQYLKHQLTDDVAVRLKDDMDEIIDEMNLPKVKSIRLKSELAATVDDNMSDLRSKTKSRQKEVDDLTALENESKVNILRGLEKSIDEAPIPQEKKMELKKKLKDLTPQYLKNGLSDDVVVRLKDDMDEIIDEMNLPKVKSIKLKSELAAAVDDNMNDMHRKIKDADSNFPTTKSKELEKEIQANIVREVENVIDAAPIPKEKKMELMQKIEELTAQYFKTGLSDEVPVALKHDMNEIIDEMNLPKHKKDKLKSELTATVDDNMSDLRSKTKSRQKEVDDLTALDKETKENIVRGLEKSIDVAPIPQEKKMGLKKKLKDLTPQYLKNQLTDDVSGALKDEMNEIIDEMNLPKHKKDKLKSDLTATVDDNMSDYQRDYNIQNNILQGLKNSIDDASIPEEKKIELKTKLENISAKNLKKLLSENTTELTKPELKELENKTKRKILQGIENAIDAAPIPQEKKMELKKKLTELMTQYLKNQLTDDVSGVLKDDMNEIIDEMNLPKHKKDELKREITATVDDNMRNLQRKIKDDDSHTKRRSSLLTVQEIKKKDRILHGIEKVIEKSAIPENKKRKLSGSRQKEVGDLTALDNESKVNILRGLENVITETPLPEEKKIEVQKKLKDLTPQYLKNGLSDDVVVRLKDDMDEIIDEMNLPKVKSIKLKSELAAAVDDNMNDMHRKIKDADSNFPTTKSKELEKEIQANIVREVENVIDAAPIPKEKKMELMQKIEELTAQYFKTGLSDEVPVALKHDMNGIIDEMNLPKHKKDKLKSELTATVDDNMSDLRNKAKSRQKEVDDLKALDKETKENIVRGLEKSIDEAPIPQEKKMGLKKKLKDLTPQYLKNQLTDDVSGALKDEMNEIIDEMNLPKHKKDKLKSDLTATVDDNMSNYQRDYNIQNNILQGLKNSIDDASIPEQKKIELKTKLENISAKNLKKLLSENTTELTKPELKELENKTKRKILQGIENAIDAAPIPQEKKMELKKKLTELMTQYLKNQLTDDVSGVLKDDMKEIIDEMNLPKHKKDELKREITATVDDNMRNLQRKIKDDNSHTKRRSSLLTVEEIKKKDRILHGIEKVIEKSAIPENKKRKLSGSRQKEVDDLTALDNESKVNILRGLEKSIDEAPIPQEKKMELKKKLKDLTPQYLKNQLTDDDVSGGLKDEMNEIIDEMNLPKHKKDKLKSELTATVDDNMSDLRNKTKSRQKEVDDLTALDNESKLNILRGLEKSIDEAPIPQEKKMELKKKLKDLTPQYMKNQLTDDVSGALKDDMNEIIDEMNLPKHKKDELKREITATVDDNMRNLQRKIKDDDPHTKIRSSLLTVEEIKKKDRILHGIEKVIEKSAIPENKKRKLSGVLQKIAADDLKRRLSDDVQDKGSTQIKLNELKKKTLSDIFQSHEKAIAKAKIPKEVRKYLKNKLKEFTNKHFMKPLTDNTAQEIKEDIHKEIDDQNLPEDLKDHLKIELDEAVDKNMRNLLKRLEDLKIKPVTTKDEGLKDIFHKFGINPRYQKQLAEEFNKLLEIARNGGDLEDARRKLIRKLMRDLNLSEDEASALADELLGKAQNMAQKDQTKDLFDKYGIDPSYEDQLAKEFNKLLEIARKGGDFKDARNKLIKLMKDLNLSEEEATALADELIDKAQKMALKELLRDIFDTYGVDPSYEDQLVEDFNKLREIARKGGDFKDARNKLIKKFMKDLNLPEEEASALTDELIDRAGKMALKELLRDIFDTYGVDPSYEDQLAEDFNKLLEIARNGGDLEDARRKLIKKLMRDLNLPEEEASALTDELIDRAGKMALKEHLRDIFDTYGVDPSYEDQLAKEFNKLLEIARKGGDFKDPRNKLIKKLMKDLNLSEEEATALADELIDKAQKMALKEHLRDIFDKYEVDPSYEDQLAEEFNKLLEIAHNGGDLEDARRKLIKKLMKDLNLSEEEASALADELIDKAQKMAQKDQTKDLFDKYGIDPSYEDQLAEEFNKLLEIARNGGDLEDARRKLIKKLMRDLNLSEEEASALADELLGKAQKMALKDQTKDLFNKYGIDPSYEDQLAKEFNKLLEIARKGGDFKDARNKLIKKLMKDLNLPEEEASALTDELIDKAQKMALKEHLRDIFDKYEVDPSYEDQLVEDFKKLLEVARKGGDFKDAGRKLVKKLMRDLNLPEEEASALTDELIDRAGKMALKEHLRDIFDKYEVDPSYEDQLAEEFNKLLEIAHNGGDLEDARRKLIKKLMRDLNLSEEEASALADELIDKAQKMAQKDQTKDLFDKYGIDPSYEDQLAEEFNKLLEIARKGRDFKDARNKLIKKLMKDLNLPEEEASALADELIDKAQKMALKEHLRDIFDKYGIDPIYEDKLAEEFNKLLEIAEKDGDLEDAKGKLIKILKRDLNLSEAEASALADDLIARAREMALAGKTTEAFTQAISDAVDQSTVAQADKPILKNKLLSKLTQILDKKPYFDKDDIYPLKEEVLKECNEIVDESFIPPDKKKELKQLLKEKLDKASAEDEDGEVESLADYKDKITKPIKKWRDSLPINLDPKVAATVADNIASDILDRHKYVHAHPEAKSNEKDETENLKYQVFRRMHRVVNPEAIPKVMESTPDLYKTIMNIKPPPQEPKTKPKDAFAKTGRGAVDEKTHPLAQKKMKELKKVFAKSVDQAVVESSLSKPDKRSIKQRLLKGLGITTADRKKAEKYDAGPSDAVDKSPTELEHKKKIRECVKTWLDTLPIDLDPKTAAPIADNLTNDILERQKYLRTHLEAVPKDEDEIENLMYQVFRRLEDILDPEGIPNIKKRTEDLYNMIMNIKKELDSQKEQGTSSKRRRDPSPQDRKKSTSAALSTGNINYSLRKLIASTKGVRKQWSRNSDDAITKIPNLKTDEKLNDILAIYNETGGIDMLSIAGRSKARTSAYQTSKKQFVPKPVPNNKEKSRLSNIKETFAFNNTNTQNSPFNPNQNQITEKDYVKILNNIITNWIDKAKLNISPNETCTLVNELVCDIVDWQKYLQKFESADATRSDLYEYLKVQVHRRMNTLVPASALKTIVEGVGELVAKIEQVPVPKMVAATNENVQRPQMVPATNEYDQRPQMVPATKYDQRPQMVPATNEYGQRPQMVPATNEYDQRPQMVPATNEYGQRPQMVPATNEYGQRPQMVPATNEYDQRPQMVPATNVYDQRPQMVPAPNDYVQRPQMVPATNEYDQRPQMVPATNVYDQRPQMVPAPNDYVQRPQMVPATNEYVQRPQMVPATNEYVQRPQMVPATNEYDQRPQMVPATNEYVQRPQMVAPPKSLPKSPIKSPPKSPVSKKNNTKQKKNIQSSPSSAAETPTDEVPETVDDDGLEHEMANTEFSPRQTSSPIKTRGEEYMDRAESMDKVTESMDKVTESMDKVTESIRTWIDSVPIHLKPDVQTEVTNDLANDIIDRLKYLQVHPEKMISKKDEIENLRYQVFKRLDKVTDDESLILDNDKIEELYKMISEQGTSSKRRTDPSPQDWKKSTSAALSTGNINYSLRKLIASTKGVRKQWSRNSDDAITKIPNLTKDEILNDILAIYDETGQIDKLSTASRSIQTSAYQDRTSNKQFVPKPVPKNTGKSCLSKIEETFSFNNTNKQNSPFNPNKNQITEKDYVKILNNIITNWLDKAKVNIAPIEKNKIVDELVRDLVERQKYLQEYAIANASRSDELEYLKVQVHRRLNTLVPAGSLKTIVEGTGKLTAKLENVQIPKMVAATKENVQMPQMVAPPKISPKSPTKSLPKSPPKTSKKSPVSKKKKTKQKRNSQTTPSNGETSTEEVQNNKKTVDDDAFKQEMSNTEFSPGQASTPSKPTGEKYTDKVTESTRKWIESVPINLELDVQTEVIKDLANDIIDRQKFLQVHPEKMISKMDEIENLRYQVFKRLDKVTDDESLIPDINKIEELYKMINGDSRRRNLTPKEAQEFQTTLPDEIASVLNDYNICCERRELLSSLTKELAKLGNSNADQDEIIENLTEVLKRISYLNNCDMCDDETEDLAYKLLARTKKLIARIQQSKGAPVKKKDFREAIMNDIGDVFYGCPMSADKRRMMECQLAEDYAKDLGIPLHDSEVTMTGAGLYGMSFNGLTNFIDTWLSSIHTEDDDTKDESEINETKKDMAYNLIHKIGEMNVDPEIFNDNAHYEAILRDELQNMLGDITMPDEEIEPLKEDLINKVLEAKQRAHDEFAGQAYKRHLRDTISQVLPDQGNLSKEEQATMETLKDQLADAYIDLHFSGNNEPQREKLKRKISNELNRFCRDYMNKVPCAPLSSQKINQDLYAALNAVPLPAKDSIRYEVEQARIREQINDWLKELPIQPQNPTELLARNKMVYVLAKKLFDNEIEGNDTDNDSKRAEIVKFLNRLPLETDEDLETLADTLIDKLTATEESRKYNASSNVTIDSFGNVSMNTPVCSKHKTLFEKRKASPGPSDSQMVCGRPTCKQPKPMHPCTLSPEDRDYLERIRRRTYLSPSCVRSILKDNKPKTCPGMQPVDSGSQTIQKPHGYQRPRSPICRIADERTPRTCSGQPANAYSQHRWGPCGNDKPQRPPICPVSQQKIFGPCPGTSRASLPCGRPLWKHTVSSNNICDGNEEVQPELTVKKYHWSPNDNSVEESEIPQNARCIRGEPSLRHHTSPTPCNKIRISSGAQCSPPPCGRPSLSKLQQDTGPQRTSCDLTRPALSPAPKPQHQPSSSPYGDPQRSIPPSCAPSPCMSPFRLSNQPSPSSFPFSKRDNLCRIPKRDGLDHPNQMPCSSSSRPFRKERVIELGSLDNLSNARPKKRHNDGSDWHFEDEEEDNFWCSPPIRRVILDEGIDDSVVMEREQKEERIRCKCKERLVPKSQAGRAHPGHSPSQQFTHGNDVAQNLKKCAKCCGRHCPYPSYLYFRQ